MSFLKYWNKVYDNLKSNYEMPKIESIGISVNDNDFVIRGTELSPFLHRDYKLILKIEYNRIYKFIIDDIVELYVITKENDKLMDLANIFKRIHAFYLHFKSHDKMRIIIYQTDFKKTFTSPLSVKNINSGSTGYIDDERYILMWRSEEMSKVLIHELIHALDIDYYRNYNMLYCESLTETMAQLYHILFLLLELKESFKKFVYYFNTNLKYSLDIVEKFMNMPKDKYGKVNMEDYFINRTALMLNIEKYTEFLEEKRDKDYIMKMIIESRELLNKKVKGNKKFKEGDGILMFSDI